MCDPLQYTYSIFNAARCLEGARIFERDAAPLTKIRQEIGQARLKPDAKRAIPPLLKKLRQAAAPVIDTYTKNKATCDASEDAKACGYAYYYGGFTKLFGPIDASTKPKESPVHIPLASLPRGHIVANVATKVDGEAGPSNQEVLFDTGNSNTFFSKSYFLDNRMNFSLLPEMQVAAPGSVTHMSLYTVDRVSFSFGKTVFSPSVVTAHSMIDAYEGSDRRHSLIAFVGLDFLLSTPFEVNYTRSEMVLHQDIDQRLTAGKWEALPIGLERFGIFGVYHINIDIFLNGHPITAWLDTGADRSSLEGTCTGVLKGTTRTGVTLATTVAGTGESAIYTMDLKLGSRGERSIEMPVSSGPGTCRGRLGLNVINGYDFMIDPDTATAYFSANPGRQVLRKFWLCGFSPKRVDERMLVAGVDPGGPAASAGLKKGDVIIEINDRNADELSMLNVHDLLIDSTPPTTMVIARNGERKKIVIDRH